MTGYTVHTGASEKFVVGWDTIFGNGKTPKKAGKSTAKANKTAAGSQKKKPSTKKRSAAKRSRSK